MPKININGVVREMDEHERAEYARLLAEMPPPEPTPEDRLTALEAENAHLKEALEMLLSGVTEDG